MSSNYIFYNTFPSLCGSPSSVSCCPDIFLHWGLMNNFHTITSQHIKLQLCIIIIIIIMCDYPATLVDHVTKSNTQYSFKCNFVVLFAESPLTPCLQINSQHILVNQGHHHVLVVIYVNCFIVL
jgi:hypothetical protein